MKYTAKYKDIQLEHDDLVTIISDGTYGSNDIRILIPVSSKELYKSFENADDCWEDMLAKILLNGGKIHMVDMLSEEELDNWKAEGNTGLAIACIDVELDPYSQMLNERIKQKRIEAGEDVEKDPKYGCVVYEVGIDDFNRAASSEEGNRLMDIFENEEDDFYTGWNFLQLVMFGEVIYG